jgi:hypothetical protein
MISYLPLNTACKFGMNTLKINCFRILKKKCTDGSIYCLHPVQCI